MQKAIKESPLRNFMFLRQRFEDSIEKEGKLGTSKVSGDLQFARAHKYTQVLFNGTSQSQEPGNTEQGKSRLTNEYPFFLFIIG